MQAITRGTSSSRSASRRSSTSDTRRPSWRRRRALPRSATSPSWRLPHAFLPQLAKRFRTLLQPLQAHASKDAGSLRELDVSVVDDLDVVAPWITKVEPASGRDLDAGLLERGANGLLVVDHQSDMAGLLW